MGSTAPERSDRTKQRQSIKAVRVLIVDDLVDAAESLARLLRFDKHEVRTSYSGPAALAVAQEFKPDAVLLDIGLPDLDGFTVAEELRRQPGCRGIAIIAITGHSLAIADSRAAQSGIDRYLTKPIRIDQLQQLLAQFFPGGDGDS
jgi:two-component system CheB/CheR fusion protein